MTETQKTLPSGKVATIIPAADGWTVTAYRVPNALVSKLIAIAPGGKSAIHRDKVTDADLAKVAAEMTGAAAVSPAIPVDIMDQLGASIEAAKAKKAVA